MTFVDLNNICVSYDGKSNVLENLNLAIEEGQLVSLLGPSGCGKTTTLRVIAGLIHPNDGQFVVDGQDLTHVPVHQRKFGMVFQSYALFPHLSIYDNVAFGLKMQKIPDDQIKTKVHQMLEITGLASFAQRYPKQLSGGQRQRVALARALVIEPKLLLLDEPLSNLDAKLRVSMRTEIKRIQRQLGITTVFVTHDQEECFSISDKVAVMNKGVIEQYDSPEAIYQHPRTEFVANFIGFENFIDLTQNQGQLLTSDGQVLTHDQSVPRSASRIKGTIRPDDIQIVTPEQSAPNRVVGQVLVRTFLGKSYQYEVDTPLGKLLVNDATQPTYQTGDTLHLSLDPNKLTLLQA